MAVQASLFGAGTGSHPGSMPRPAQQGPDPGRGGGHLHQCKGECNALQRGPALRSLCPGVRDAEWGGGGRSVRFNLKVNFFHQNEKPRKTHPKWKNKLPNRMKRRNAHWEGSTAALSGGEAGRNQGFFQTKLFTEFDPSSWTVWLPPTLHFWGKFTIHWKTVPQR